MLGAMKAPLHWSLWFGCTLALAGSGCRSDPTHTPPPPPLPVAPPASPPTPVPEPVSDAPQAAATTGGTSEELHPASAETPKHATNTAAKHTGTSLYDLAARGEASLPAPAQPAPAPTPSAPAPAKPPVAPAPAPVAPAPSAPKSKVSIPSTAHLKVEVPTALQAELDLDPRMQPWANTVINVIDGCYATERQKNQSAAGTISVVITMHTDSRPDADIKALPSALSGVLACATGGLMRTKMPLFTGKEGEKHAVNIRFTQ